MTNEPAVGGRARLAARQRVGDPFERVEREVGIARCIGRRGLFHFVEPI
jgi:hypothetical protein